VLPVYVNSKGRPTGKAFALMAAAGIRPVVFVEPQDEVAYRKAGHRKLVVLDEDDRGLTVARNRVFDYSESKGVRAYWLIDDDVNHVYTSPGDGKCHPAEIGDVLTSCERVLEQLGLPLGQAAMEYQQFAWSAKRPYTLNTYCDVAVVIYAENLRSVGARWDEDLKYFKSDRDLTLQSITRGLSTIRLHQFAFSTPKNGSNDGGMAPMYAVSGLEEAESLAMCEKWPGICTFNLKKDGRPDVAINWRMFR